MYLCQEQAGWTLGLIARLLGLTASGSAGAAIRNVLADVRVGDDGLFQSINKILHDLTPSFLHLWLGAVQIPRTVFGVR